MAKATSPCPLCKSEGFWTDYMGDVGKRMKLTGECFECAFWGIRCFEEAPNRVVIDNCAYTIGEDVTPEQARIHYKHCGMSGRRFDIELDNGYKFTTRNLWHGGEIPERFRSWLPNNAKFITGGKRSNAFDPADPRTPEYPSFFNRGHT